MQLRDIFVLPLGEQVDAVSLAGGEGQLILEPGGLPAPPAAGYQSSHGDGTAVVDRDIPPRGQEEFAGAQLDVGPAQRVNGDLSDRFAGPCGELRVFGQEALDLLVAVFYEPGQFVSLVGDVGEVCLEL